LNRIADVTIHDSRFTLQPSIERGRIPRKHAKKRKFGRELPEPANASATAHGMTRPTR